MRPRRAAAAAARALRVPSPSPSSSSSPCSSPQSIIEISEDESDAFVPAAATADAASDDEDVSTAPSPSPSAAEESEDSVRNRGTKRKRGGRGTATTKLKDAKGRAKSVAKGVAEGDIEDCVPRPHGPGYHGVEVVVEVQQGLLDWFEGVRDVRGMPWRKRYDPTLSIEEKGQRAYEIWVSEVMLQQTQVATVINYWKAWMAKWPTIADLANADLEEVNAAWRGLGYYRRAKGLLAGAAVITGSQEYNQRLPSDPDVLEKGVPGVGRYTAGAICSMAYGVRTPIVDGNIHRVLTRLLALHAPQTSPDTIRFLWSAAEALVDALPRGLGRGIAGDWNQALMELGATVCKPVSPACGECPVRDGCKAYAEAELSRPPPSPELDECTLCELVPGDAEGIPSVTVFPMKKVKKESRVEHEVVVVTEWRGVEKRFLFVKRPEKGLLAGLFEPPTVPVTSTSKDLLEPGAAHVQTLLGLPSLPTNMHNLIAPVQHIFSHINMTYHVQHLVLTSSSDDATEPPRVKKGGREAAWLTLEETRDANVGTGVKKCWSAVYGRWGEADEAGPKATAGGAGKARLKAEPGSKAKPKGGAKGVTKVKAEPKTAKCKPASKAKSAPKRASALQAKGVSANDKRAAESDEDADTKPNSKVVKRVRMPAMPRRKVAEIVEVEVQLDVKDEAEAEIIIVDD